MLKNWKIVSPLASITAVDLADNITLTLGNDSDIAMVLNTAGLSADEELANVIVGTSVHPATNANSLIISNITNDGDILILASDGGNSKAGIFIDASVPYTYLYNGILGSKLVINGKAFDAGSRSAQINTTGSGEGLDLYSTNNGTNGVRISAYHITTNPAIDDVLFEYYIYGNATGGAQREAATLRFLVEAVGATTLAGKMAILLRTGSAWNEALALSSAGDLWLDGGITTGGSTPLGRTQHWFSGNFVSDGSSDFAWKQTCGGSLTGADGDTAELIGSLFANTIATQTIVDESIGLIAQVEIDEPTITDNLSGTGVITVAATLYVKGAPDEGVSNAAVWVNAGDIKFAGETDSAAVADQVALGGYDVGVNERALAISQECAVAAEVDETKFSHKMPIRINGATYFMMLTQS